MLALDILPFGPHFGVRLFVPGAGQVCSDPGDGTTHL